MALLWHEWPQNGHQLSGGYVVDGDYTRYKFIPYAVIGDNYRSLLGGDIWHDFDDVAHGHSGKTVYLQNGEKNLIDLVLVHRFGGDHRDFSIYAGIHHKILVRNLGHSLNQGLHVRPLEIKRKPMLLRVS